MTQTMPFHDPDTITALRGDLAACRYDADQVPTMLGADAHNALGRGFRYPALDVTARRAAAGDALATVTRLFLLGTAEPAAAVEAALPRLTVRRGLADGVLEEAGDGRIRGAVDIRPHADDLRSYLVVSDFDSDCRPGPVRPDHVLGIGAASVMLARMVIRRPAGRVLDLGTGCGIQALHCAAHADSITVTDTNPRALALAAATAALNGQQWDLRRGSLFEPVAGERFDLIVSNPPFVISSGERRFEYRDSGMAGDALCRLLVEGLAEHLNPGGTAQLLANWMIRGNGDWRLAVGGWVAATGLDGWVVQREVARPAEYVSMWLRDAGETLGDEDHAQQVAGEWLDYFRRESVTGIGMGSITLRRPDEDRPGRAADVVFDELTGEADRLTGPEVDAFLARRRYLAATDDDELAAARLSLADTDILDKRFVASPDGFRPVLRVLTRPGGPGATVQLDEWGEALLAGCTGALPLGTLIDLLATAHGIDRDALAAAVIPAVRSAITRGILHPTEGL